MRIICDFPTFLTAMKRWVLLDLNNKQPEFAGGFSKHVQSIASLYRRDVIIAEKLITLNNKLMGLENETND